MNEFSINWKASTYSEAIEFEDSFTRDIMNGYIWWSVLTLISLYNITAIQAHWKAYFASKLDSFQSKMLYLSTVYVIVCAIRAIWPRKHVDRICFFDAPINYPFVGRFIATIAELCFVKQCALVLQEIIIRYNFQNTLWFLHGYKYYVPFVGIAEICSWIGVATKCQMWNAFEESIWTLTELHMTICYILLYVNKNDLSRKSEEIRRYLLVCIVGGLMLVMFMCTVYVPMYVQRWYVDQMNGVQYLSVYDGLIDLMQCKSVAHGFEIWWEDVPWMTGYFSIGVWLSIYLINISVVVNMDNKKAHLH